MQMGVDDTVAAAVDDNCPIVQHMGIDALHEFPSCSRTRPDPSSPQQPKTIHASCSFWELLSKTKVEQDIPRGKALADDVGEPFSSPA